MNEVQSHTVSDGGHACLSKVRRFDPREVARRLEHDERFTVLGEHWSEHASMVGVIQISKDDPPDAWEQHDGGDELLVLLSGRVEMKLRQPDGQLATHELSAGEALLIPAALAHSGRALTPRAEVLFVTPRQGTREWLEAGGEACRRS